MITGTCQIVLYAEWVHSLKEKRMIVKSLTEKMKHKYNISVAEVDQQDVHQSIVIGFACVSNQRSHVDSMISNVVSYVEHNTDAVVADVAIEIL